MFFVPLYFYNPITLFEMDTLTTIAVSLPDTIVINATPKEVILHSCPVATSNEDILFALTIGLIILAGLAIIGHYVCKGIATTQLNKFNELKSRQDHEIAKLDKEAEIKTAVNQFNAKQTKEQREWLSDADKLRNEIEKQNVRLKEAEVNDKISELEKKNFTKQENPRL